MATNLGARSLLFRPSTHSIFSSLLSRSFSSSSAVVSRPASLFRSLRHLSAAAAAASRFGSSTFVSRCLSTRATTSSLNDPSPNWSNRPPKETILLDGCDFEHWLVVMEKPEGDPTRDDIIDSYIKTLAMVVGSEEEAKMKIYSVSTRHYFAFGALVSEELSFKIKELPRVRWVLPDSYLDVRNKDYGGEPFINGVAVPYDPKYHEEWVRNNARANERNRRNDRPRNFDRSRNYDRRRENTQNQNPRGPPMNNQGMPNAQPNTAGTPQNYQGGSPPQPNYNRGGLPQQPQQNYSPPPQQNYNGPPPPQQNYNVPPPQQNNYNGLPPHQNNYNRPPPQQNNFSGPPPQPNYSGPPPQQNNFNGPQPSHFGNYPPQNNMGGNFQNVPHQGAPSNYQNEYGTNSEGGMPGRQPY